MAKSKGNTAILVQQIPELGELRELMTSLNEKVDGVAETIQTLKDKGLGPMGLDGPQIANSHGCYVYNHCSFQTPHHSATHTLDKEQAADLKNKINVYVLECEEKFYMNQLESSWEWVYPIRHRSPKAHVLILNNYKGFEGGSQQDRPGADIDEELMRQLWEGFQCEVKVEKNQTAEEMLESLVKFSKSDIHEKCDFCVVIIMSHGGLVKGNGVFYGIDNATIENDKVVELFKNSEDRLHLIGKPKLIFFQSCRGDSSALGVPVPPTSTDVPIRKMDQADKVKNQKIPERCDILVAYPTAKGDIALRETAGSWFINAIATVFSEHAKTEHVADMLTMVRYSVSQQMANAPLEQFHGCQVSTETQDRLRKKLYLFPGFPKTNN